MPDIGEPFNRLVTVSTDSFIEYFADSGEKWKVTMIFSKRSSAVSKSGDMTTKNLFVSPATGNEAGRSEGTNGSNNHPPLGGNAKGGTDQGGLQPVYITDSNGLYIGNDGPESIVAIQGVRVA